MSCLFQSLSAFIKNISSTDMRRMIVEYLEKDPVIFKNPDQRLSDILNIDNVPLVHYIEMMKKDYTWGGAIEIKAFCELFSCRVIVIVLSSKKQIEFCPSVIHHKMPEFRISWDGGHYEPILCA